MRLHALNLYSYMCILNEWFNLVMAGRTDCDVPFSRVSFVDDRSFSHWILFVLLVERRVLLNERKRKEEEEKMKKVKEIVNVQSGRTKEEKKKKRKEEKRREGFVHMWQNIEHNRQTNSKYRYHREKKKTRLGEYSTWEEKQSPGVKLYNWGSFARCLYLHQIKLRKTNLT